MTTTPTLRGFSNISFWAADMAAAKKWYTELFGIEPYFQRPDENNPAYLEWRIGDYQHEFGIIDKKYAPQNTSTTPGGAVMYWHVDEVEATFAKLIAMGAKEYEPPTQRGEGFFTASVIDPFGNILGIMYNPHYLEIFNTLKKR